MGRVFINGCFDILHPGHVNLIKAARIPGGFLRIAIDSDERVKLLKGANRPINNQDFRKTMLLALRGVDEVVIFNSDEELEKLIKHWHPNLMVKGADYIGKPIIGSQYCDNIKFVDLDGNSTTKTIQGITSR